MFTTDWVVVAAWLGLRIALWLNISVVEDLGLIEAMTRSYALMRGQVPRLLILGGIPRGLAWGLSWLMGKVLPGHAVLLYYVKALLDGATMVFVTGVVVAFYIELRAEGSKEALIEAVPAAAGPGA
jgi:hypothetical protein